MVTPPQLPGAARVAIRPAGASPLWYSPVDVASPRAHPPSAPRDEVADA